MPQKCLPPPATVLPASEADAALALAKTHVAAHGSARGRAAVAAAQAWQLLRLRKLDEAQAVLSDLAPAEAARDAVARIAAVELNVLRARSVTADARGVELDAAQRGISEAVRLNRTPPLSPSRTAVQVRSLLAASVAYSLRRHHTKALQVLRKLVRTCTEGGTCVACGYSGGAVASGAGAGAGSGAGAGVGAGGPATTAAHAHPWCPVLTALLGIAESHLALGDLESAAAAFNDALAACPEAAGFGVRDHVAAGAAWVAFKANSGDSAACDAAAEALGRVCTDTQVQGMAGAEQAYSRCVQGVCVGARVCTISGTSSRRRSRVSCRGARPGMCWVPPRWAADLRCTCSGVARCCGHRAARPVMTRSSVQLRSCSCGPRGWRRSARSRSRSSATSSS